MEKYGRSMTLLVSLATVILIIVALYFGKPVLMPLALSVLLSFLLSPVADGLHRLGIGRTTSVVFLVIFVAFIFAAGAYGIGTQISTLAFEMPKYKDNIREKIVALREAGKGSAFERLQQTVRELKGELRSSKAQATTSTTTAESSAPASEPEEAPVAVVVTKDKNAASWQVPSALGPLLELLATTGLVIVLVIFMLLRRRELRNRFILLCGYSRMPATTQALDEAGARISRYLLMQTLINTVFGVAVGAGLYFVGLPYALLWGFLAGALRFIPYVGPWLGASLPILLSLAVFPGWLHPFIVLGIFAVLELTANMILEPLLYGQSAGVSEVALLVAVAFWTWAWGPIGLALATPLTVCLVVLGKYVPGLSFIQTLMGDEPAMDSQLVFYQRLLAMDKMEAQEIAEEFRRKHPLVDYYDQFLLPALVSAKRDLIAQKLTPEHLDFIAETVAGLIEKASGRRARGKGCSEPHASDQPRILCIPAEDRLDQLALSMLKTLLPGHPIEIAAPSALSGEIVDLIQRCQPAAVCLAAIAPGGSTELRHLLRRLRMKFPELRILTSRFGMENPKNIRNLEEELEFTVAVTLEQTKNILMQSLQLTSANHLDLSERAEHARYPLQAAQHN